MRSTKEALINRISKFPQDTEKSLDDKSLGIRRQDIYITKRELEMELGPVKVSVREIPAPLMSLKEWNEIKKARKSYTSMWGGEGAGKITEDPFDGTSGDSPYETYHYIARIEIPGILPEKFITMRKVSLKKDLFSTEQSLEELPELPDDITFWKVKDQESGKEMPFKNILRTYISRKNRQNSFLPETRIAAISRTGTYPFLAGNSELEKETSGIAFALIQIAATDYNKHQLLVCQLCPEFQEKVLAINNGGKKVMLDFNKTEDTLGLSSKMQLVLDNKNSEVIFHKTRFPGYWINNHDASLVIQQLVKEDKLSGADFVHAWKTYSEDIKKYRKENTDQQPYQPVLPATLPELIEHFTSSRYFKYLIPLINTEGMINQKLSGQELRNTLIHEAKDGPFSSTLIPEYWRKSAFNLLRQAKNKYGTMH